MVLGRYSPLTRELEPCRASKISGRCNSHGERLKGIFARECWDDDIYQVEDGHGYTTVLADSRYCPYATEIQTSSTEIDLGAFVAGDSDWVRRDVHDAEPLIAYVEEAAVISSYTQRVLDAQRPRSALHQVQGCRGFWPVLEISGSNSQISTLRVQG